ncbi:ROK family protein [Nocardioides alcanivorans]|uniref:ROK family protein n=1 Tax=Nocardioides alcanivorans TaxID=2897352 RepID=UPI001F20FBB2|nr:ROK family protein [Nocardioides alcanivorans]
MIDKGEQTEVGTVNSLEHYPTGGSVRCKCGRTGCFEVTASDHALVARAVDIGLIDAPRMRLLQAKAAAGDAQATRMFVERAEVLGRVAAGVRDMTGPDRTVLVGQAFTGFPAALTDVIASFERSSSMPPGSVSVTRFGDDIQAVAACALAVGPVYDDPVGLVTAWEATG